MLTIPSCIVLALAIQALLHLMLMGERGEHSEKGVDGEGEPIFNIAADAGDGCSNSS